MAPKSLTVPKGTEAADQVVGDVTPDRHVEQLVQDERAEAPNDDLLDSRRPID